MPPRDVTAGKWTLVANTSQLTRVEADGGTCKIGDPQWDFRNVHIGANKKVSVWISAIGKAQQPESNSQRGHFPSRRSERPLSHLFLSPPCLLSFVPISKESRGTGNRGTCSRKQSALWGWRAWPFALEQEV